MKKTTRKLLATLLAFTMLFGSSMTVFAQEYEWDELFIGQELYDGDQIIVMGASVGQNEQCDVILEVNYRQVDGGHYPGKDKFSYPISIPENKAWKVDNKFKVEDADASPCCMCKYYIIGHEIDVAPSPSPTPTPSSNPVEEPTKVEEVHSHSYSWVTVQEATTEQDGMEEYRCSCGAVAERSVIPASQVFVKGLYGEIKNAPLNGTVTFDSGRLYTMSDYIIKKLAERSDVTTVVTFEYNKTAYRMTIPAGADYSALLADEDYFYGYFYFAQLVGATIEEL